MLMLNQECVATATWKLLLYNVLFFAE